MSFICYNHIISWTKTVKNDRKKVNIFERLRNGVTGEINFLFAIYLYLYERESLS